MHRESDREARDSRSSEVPESERGGAIVHAGYVKVGGISIDLSIWEWGLLNGRQGQSFSPFKSSHGIMVRILFLELVFKCTVLYIRYSWLEKVKCSNYTMIHLEQHAKGFMWTIQVVTRYLPAKLSSTIKDFY